MLRQARLFLVAILLLLGCSSTVQQKPSGCQVPVETAIFRLEYKSAAEPQVLEWIQDMYNLTAAEINRADFESTEITSGLFWGQHGKGYFAAFHQGILEKVEVRWEANHPTGEAFIQCYGPPDRYGAYFYEVPAGNVLDLELWYLEQGLVVRHIQLDLAGPPEVITGQEGITVVTVVKPSAVRAVAESAYRSRSRQVIAETVETLQPWPGRWDALKVLTTVQR